MVAPPETPSVRARLLLRELELVTRPPHLGEYEHPMLIDAACPALRGEDGPVLGLAEDVAMVLRWVLGHTPSS